MAQRQPISRDRNYVGTPRGPVPSSSSSNPSRSRQPISQDRDYVGRAAPRDPARALRGATGIGAGPGDPSYQFPAEVKQGVGGVQGEPPSRCARPPHVCRCARCRTRDPTSHRRIYQRGHGRRIWSHTGHFGLPRDWERAAWSESWR